MRVLLDTHVALALLLVTVDRSLLRHPLVLPL